MMDGELLGNSSIGATFERREGVDTNEPMAEEDIEYHMLKNLLESHAQSLGTPSSASPASQLLAQLGINLPAPPPPIKKGKK
jgi:hypothetical protein